MPARRFFGRRRGSASADGAKGGGGGGASSEADRSGGGGGVSNAVNLQPPAAPDGGLSGGGGGKPSSSGKKSSSSSDHPPAAIRPTSSLLGGLRTASASLADEAADRAAALSSFDACVEAADALAASSSSGSSGRASGLSDDLPDCSVLVSPDGALLFLPKPEPTPPPPPSSSSDGPSTPVKEAAKTLTPIPLERKTSTPKELYPNEEYQSAVTVGCDSIPGGDKAANGFSATGWSSSAATVALRRGGDVLRATGTFVEELVLSRKEGAALACRACDGFRSALYPPPEGAIGGGGHIGMGVAGGHGSYVSPLPPATSKSRSTSGGSRWRLRRSGSNASAGAASSTGRLSSVDLDSSHEATGASGHSLAESDAGDSPTRGTAAADPSSCSPRRSGPLLHAGTTLRAAADAVEHYHTLTAEGDANRWRVASQSSSRFALHADVDDSGTSRGRDDGHGGISSCAGMLPAIRLAAERASARARNREAALEEARSRAEEAEARLILLKAESRRKWEAVSAAEREATILLEEKTRERSRERERRRLEAQRLEEERRAAASEGGSGTDELDAGATEAEIWDLVKDVAESMEDGSFAPTGLPMAPERAPRDQSSSVDPEDSAGGEPAGAVGGGDKCGAQVRDDRPSPSPPPLPEVSRSDIEVQLDLPSLRVAALAADDVVEDAAGALLNVLSSLDTTRRSARIAAETALLSVANAQASCLKALVKLERASIEERLRHVEELERKVDGIDVRKDLDSFINDDKGWKGGSTRLGGDDDGGVASALAVLNSHGEGAGVPEGFGAAGKVGSSVLEGWADSDGGTAGGPSEGVFSAEEIEDAAEYLFADNPLLSRDDDDDASRDDEATAPAADAELRAAQRAEAIDEFERTVSFLVRAVEEKSTGAARNHRNSVCFAFNQQRSIRTEVRGQIQFDGLCRVFDAMLRGCDAAAGAADDVANAKMCMMLAQTFYVVGGRGGDEEEEEETARTGGTGPASPTGSDREKRMYVKSKLVNHPLWSDEDFWDQALFQCVSESLTQSGVMSNFERPSHAVSTAEPSEWTPSRKLKWHDMRPDERAEAASQVHAVVFAQLGALAHSMVEFGCGVDRACAFVRRLSVRHQLPLSQRTMLLRHLIGRTGDEVDVEDRDAGGDGDDGGTEEEEGDGKEGGNAETSVEATAAIMDGVWDVDEEDV